MSAARDRSRIARVALVVRAIWGSLLVFAPGRALRLLGGADNGPIALTIIRVLGLRHLLEAGIELRRGAVAHDAGIAVDVLHAASALAFAGIDRRWRPAAVADAGVAVGFAMIGIVDRRPGVLR